MTTPIDTTRLRALLEGTTPGPWKAGREEFESFDAMCEAQRRMLSNRPFGEPFHFVWTRPDLCVGYTANGPTSAANAAFIAAMDPTTVRALLDEVERLRAPVPRPLDEWHDDDGAALWWTLPVCEPPYSGAPGWSDWPGYHTHWTPFVCPREEGGTP